MAAISLTPNPDHEAEDLATVIPPKRLSRILAEHGFTAEDFYADHYHAVGISPTLSDVRNWLGY